MVSMRLIVACRLVLGLGLLAGAFCAGAQEELVPPVPGQFEPAAPPPEGGEPVFPPGLKPVNDARPRGGAVQTQPVYLDFEGVELSQIIKSIGAMTGKNFLFDPQLGTIPVTLISHAPIEPDMLLPALQAVLVTHGFTLRETLDGELLKVRPLVEGTEKVDISIGVEEMPEGFEEFSTHIVPIRYALAEELAQLLPRLGSKDCRVDAYGPTNTLILSDNAHGVRNMLRFITEIDVAGSEVVMEVFQIENASATTLAEQIQSVLLGAEGQAAQAPRGVPRAPVRPAVRPPVPGQAQQTIIGSEEPVLEIVPDERLNLLVVRASESLMKDVRELVEKLDRQPDVEANNLHVYPLQNADAEVVTEKLNAIVGTTPRQGSQEGAKGGPSPEVQPFEKKVMVESFDATNSLLIVASPQDYKVIENLIAQLDVPQRQVHVQAVIMEVVIQDRFELAVESTSLSANDGFALNNVVQLANIFSSGPVGLLGTSDSVLTTGVLDGTVEIPIYDDAGAVTVQTFPKVPVLLTALDSLTDLDVLSRPMLTTVDNEEANIVIGEDLPITTGSRSSLDQTAVGSSVFNQIERREVGIKMMVKPQISEGDNVFLELEVEVSQAKQSDVGADPNLVGPTLQLSKVTTPVVVRDGATGIVGGLISESTDHSRRQTPYAGDLPVLGWLFRRKTDRRVKRNLVVLVTPHVIKEGMDADRITRHRIDEFKQANLDVFFEQGYIKKLKKRHYLRTKHRPSAAEIDRYDQGIGFDRGDVER